MRTRKELLILLKEEFLKHRHYGLCICIASLCDSGKISDYEETILFNYLINNCHTKRKNNERTFWWTKNTKGHKLRLRWLNYHIKKQPE